MAILKIIVAPDKRLSQKSMLVEKFDHNLKSFANDMIETMKKEDGVGLASTQIPDDPRFKSQQDSEHVCTWSKCDSISDNYRAQPSVIIIGINDELIIAVNPEIISHSEEMELNTEGCVSLPNLAMDVKRYMQIHVRYQDLDGKEHKKECTDLTAICFQHEIDHLNGLLAIDRVLPMQRLLLWKKYEQINNRMKYSR